jgi:DNA-binding NarL/FixJ family response regulator
MTDVTSKMINVLIVDPQPLVRASLKQQVSAAGDMQVVGEADSGASGLVLCEQLTPDVVVMDILMPGLDGLTVTQIISDRCPAVRVLIVTGLQDDTLIPIALRAGAAGYLGKDVSSPELLEAIRAAAAGLSILSARAVQTILRQPERDLNAQAAHAAHTQGMAEPPEIDLYYSLTYRERQVLRLVLLGYTSAEVGSQLFISPRTAEKHRANMMSKLSVRNQYDLTRLAYRMGVMPLDENETLLAVASEEPGLLAFKVSKRKESYRPVAGKKISAEA